MMKSLLTELFNGNLYPNEKFVHTSKYKQVNKSISKEMDFWKKTLSGDNFERLEDLQGLLCQTGSMENEHYFSLGFKLGTLIMIEVFSAKEGLFDE